MTWSRRPRAARLVIGDNRQGPKGLWVESASSAEHEAENG
jgi:hypothetical protein